MLTQEPILFSSIQYSVLRSALNSVCQKNRHERVYTTNTFLFLLLLALSSHIAINEFEFTWINRTESKSETKRQRVCVLCTMTNDKSLCIYLPEKFHIILVPFHRMQCFAVHIIFTWYFDFVSKVDHFWDGYICQMHPTYCVAANCKIKNGRERKWRHIHEWVRVRKVWRIKLISHTITLVILYFWYWLTTFSRSNYLLLFDLFWLVSGCGCVWVMCECVSLMTVTLNL